MSKRKDREAVIYLYGQPCKLRISKNLAKWGWKPEAVVDCVEALLGREWRSKDRDVHPS